MGEAVAAGAGRSTNPLRGRGADGEVEASTRPLRPLSVVRRRQSIVSPFTCEEPNDERADACCPCQLVARRPGKKWEIELTTGFKREVGAPTSAHT